MQIADVVLGLSAGVGIDLSPDGKTAYYVEWSTGQLCKVEVLTGMVTTVKTGLAYPEDVEVDWATGEIFVSERTGDVVSISQREKSQVVHAGGAPHQLALVKEPGRRFLFFVCFDSGRLLRTDLTTHTTVAVAVGLGHPVGLAIDAAHKFAYVTEQDTGALVQIDVGTGSRTVLLGGLTAPFYLAWDQTGTALFCVQRDPSNSLVKIALGPPVTISTVAAGLAWRPSGVAPRADDKLIYICADRQLQVISFNGPPRIRRSRPPFIIESISFNYPEGRQIARAIPLKDHLSGQMVPVPEFVRGVRNRPAAYVAGSLPHVKVVLRKLGGFSPGTYAVGATGSLGGIRWRNITPTFNSSGLTAPIEFELMWPLPPWVERADVSIDWFARKTPGPAIPVGVGSAVHRLYLTLGKSTAPWVSEPAWVAGLEIACDWASGATDPDAAAGLITQRYNGSGRVSYDTVSGQTFYGYSSYSFSQMIDRLNGGLGLGEKVNCTDSADTVVTLANLIGCDLWASRMSSAGGFALNPVIAIGYNVWAVPFGSGFSYHEVPWKGACTESDRIFDGCLQVDGDADPTSAPHNPLLPTNLLFGDCSAMNYRLRLCPPGTAGCDACLPVPGSRVRRQVG